MRGRDRAGTRTSPGPPVPPGRGPAVERSCGQKEKEQVAVGNIKMPQFEKTSFSAAASGPPGEALDPVAGGRGCDPDGMPYDDRLSAYSDIRRSPRRGLMMRLFTLSLSVVTLLCVAMLSKTGAAAYERYAQYYPPPPPGYGYPPPCQAVTRGPLRGAARGAAGGALFGAIGGNAGRGAAIGAGVGAVAGAVRRGTARASGACY